MRAMALVIFLRGINVGGYRNFRPSVLASQLKEYGVVNIGATGTFVALKPGSKARLRSELLQRLPFEAHVAMCTAREIRDAAAEDPFGGQPSGSDIVRFVSILTKPTRLSPTMPVRIPESGKWFVKVLARRGRFLFGIYRREMKTITCLNAIDTLFGAPATTRNWNTVRAIRKVLETHSR
jgi:uncharacterized protein (DUF1697 family)